ncbi:uncharacterized protein [Nicotiana sylvestris]|uniref:uncharacterized protein n=1 Tax=Nicotiana sylvestris TaxID=4096 RepID=UPI00388C4DBF
MVGKQVLLRVLPMKGIMRFGKKSKLNLRFIGPFEVLRRVGEVSYELALPPTLAGVHPLFHVLMLWKYYGDASHMLDFSTVQLDKDLSYVEVPVAIVDMQVRKLRSKNIASMKIQVLAISLVSSCVVAASGAFKTLMYRTVRKS